MDDKQNDLGYAEEYQQCWLINIIQINNMTLLLQNRRHAVSLPFHLSQQQRKLSEIYALHKKQPKEHLYSCNFITPIVRERKKLPISGEAGIRISNSKQRLGVPNLIYKKNSLKMREGERNPNQLSNSFQIPVYLRLKKIKRQHQYQLNGQIYLKQTEQQLQKRTKQFVKLVQKKKDRLSKKPPLLKRGQYQKKLLQNEINQCQQAILKNQYLIQKRIRIEERMKHIKNKQLKLRYSERHNDQQENEICNRSPKLIKLSLQNINEHSKIYNRIPESKLIETSIKQQDRQVSLKSSPNKYFLTENNEDQGKLPDKDEFRMQNQQMLKKLITLVKKKQRLDFLQKMQKSQFKHY